MATTSDRKTETAVDSSPETGPDALAILRELDSHVRDRLERGAS
jgi:hypothetical protein